MKYTLSFDPLVSSDIQDVVDYYNKKRLKQGVKFKKAIDNQFDTLETNPFFQIRYDNVRCLPVKKYPYMIHFTVLEDEKIVKVHGVIPTLPDNPNLNK